MMDTSTNEIPLQPIPKRIRRELVWGTLFFYIGWIWIALVTVVGGLLIGVIIRNELWVDLAYHGEIVVVSGKLEAIEYSNLAYTTDTIKWRNGHTPILAYRFSFRTPEGTPRQGVSHYPIGSAMPREFPVQMPDAQTDVVVEFPSGRPSLARIRGLRHAPWAPQDLLQLLAIAWGFGALCIYAMVGTGRARLHRLEQRALVKAYLLECTQAVSKMKGPYYQGVFRYHDRQGTPHTVGQRNYERPWTEADHVYVFYDTDHPVISDVFTDRLTMWCFTLDANGNFTPLPWAARSVVRFPMMVLALYVAILLWAFARTHLLGQ